MQLLKRHTFLRSASSQSRSRPSTSYRQRMAPHCACAKRCMRSLQGSLLCTPLLGLDVSGTALAEGTAACPADGAAGHAAVPSCALIKPSSVCTARWSTACTAALLHDGVVLSITDGHMQPDAALRLATLQHGSGEETNSCSAGARQLCWLPA